MYSEDDDNHSLSGFNIYRQFKKAKVDNYKNRPKTEITIYSLTNCVVYLINFREDIFGSNKNFVTKSDDYRSYNDITKENIVNYSNFIKNGVNPDYYALFMADCYVKGEIDCSNKQNDPNYMNGFKGYSPVLYNLWYMLKYFYNFEKIDDLFEIRYFKYSEFNNIPYILKENGVEYIKTDNGDTSVGMYPVARFKWEIFG